MILPGYHWINKPPVSNLITNALWAAPIVPIQADEKTYYSMPSFQRAQVGNPIANVNRNRGTQLDKGFRLIGSLFAEIRFLKSFHMEIHSVHRSRVQFCKKLFTASLLIYKSW